MTQVYRTLRVASSDNGRARGSHRRAADELDRAGTSARLGRATAQLESDQETRVAVLESADPDYFIPHVNLTKVAEYTAEAAKAGRPG